MRCHRKHLLGVIFVPILTTTLISLPKLRIQLRTGLLITSPLPKLRPTAGYRRLSLRVSDPFLLNGPPRIVVLILYRDTPITPW